MSIKCVGYAKIKECNSFWSWIAWSCYDSKGYYERFFGFEFREKGESR
jgi:hypothetical protein